AQPLPDRGPRRTRAPLATATPVPDQNPRRDPSRDPLATRPPRTRRSRCRRGIDSGPTARKLHPAVGLDDLADPQEPPPCRPTTSKTPPIVLEAFRSRSTQRDLAIRCHPQAPRRPHRQRDHLL